MGSFYIFLLIIWPSGKLSESGKIVECFKVEFRIYKAITMVFKTSVSKCGTVTPIKCTPLTLIAVNWYREEGERLYQMGKMICH